MIQEENYSQYDLFIVDVYNLFYRATFSSFKNDFNLINNVYDQGIINFLSMIDSYIKKYAIDKDIPIYWLFDNAKTSIQKYRKSLSEDYKKTRVEQPSWFYESLNLLELILHFYRNNSFIYREKFLEADDYVTYIINYAQNKDKNILLISNDQDWFRGLNNNVNQLYCGEVYDINKFEDKFKYKPTYSNICFYKCFYGDESDNIKGFLKNLDYELFIKIINTYSSMSQFLYNIDTISFLDLGWKSKIKKEESNLNLNWELVTVVELGDIDLKSSEIVCQYKKEKLKLIYESYNLLGKIDEDRIPNTQVKIDIIESMLQGIIQSR